MEINMIRGSKQVFSVTAVLGTLLVLGPAASAHQEAIHPAAIYQGSCASLGDAVATLNPVGSPNAISDDSGTPAAAPVGQTNPVETDMSVTTVSMSLSDLTSGTYAIDLQRTADDAGNHIACGEIGGTLTGPSDLAVALRDVSHSLESGIASLHDNGDGTTTVTVATVQNPATSAGAATVASGQDSANVTLADMSIASDTTSFKVGVPYTFVITNHGAAIHELVIEHAGDVDKPIEFDGGVAEASDIIPGSTATMTFTFTAPGTYQLACHQPGHFEAGMVLQIDVTG